MKTITSFLTRIKFNYNTVAYAKLFTVFLLASATLGVVAGVPASVQKASKETVRREIIKNISCPDYIKENSEANNVKALISVTENGNIVLHEVNSANPELKDYVTKTLSEMKINNAVPAEKFVVVIKFRVA